MSRLDTCIVEGNFLLQNGDLNMTVIGYGVAYYLGTNISEHPEPITIYGPNRTKGYNLNFEQAFNSEKIIPSGIFSVQQDYDSKYIIVPLRFAEKILDYNDLANVKFKYYPINSTQSGKAKYIAKRVKFDFPKGQNKS